MVSWERQLWTVFCNRLGVRAVELSVVGQSETDISETSCDTCLDNLCECWFWNWYRIPNRAAHDFRWHGTSTLSLQFIKINSFIFIFHSTGIILLPPAARDAAAQLVWPSGCQAESIVVTSSSGELVPCLVTWQGNIYPPPPHLPLSIFTDTPLRLRVSGVRLNSTLKLPAGQ